MSSRKKFKISDPAQESALESALNDIINGDESDIDIEIEDEDIADDPLYVPEDQDAEEEDEEDEEQVREGNEPSASTSNLSSLTSPAPRSSSSQRRLYWKTTDNFEPLPPAPFFEPPESVVINLPPQEYLTKYIPTDTYELIAFHSNQTYLAKTGNSLNTSTKEIRLFFGITAMMSYLRFPRIRMYWEKKTRIAAIADIMVRDRYFKLRAALKIVNDSEVPAAEKQKTKFWKVQPLLSSVRNGCLLNTPTTDVSIDEQMIPFWGKHAARQMVRGKPNPVGLKNFVLTCYNGLPLDFFLYEGKGDSILDDNDITDEDIKKLDIGGKVVLRLSNRLPAGCSIFMDRYFTSINLLDVLQFQSECMGTGTLQKRRIPANCSFKTDRELRAEGRGSFSQKVLSNGQIAAVKWFDNKPVIMASSIHGVNPTDDCRRWDKKQKRYIQVKRPSIVKEYNEKMGGVDYLDRMISYYRISARTRKWTVRLIFHLFDFGAAAAWIEYKLDQEKLGTRKRDILDYLGFREAIADYLLEYEAEGGEDAADDGTVSVSRPSKRARTEHPSDFIRTRKLDHLPVVLDTQNRCRMPGCKSTKARHQCPTCKVILCLMSGRNCYKDYHEL
ncbi:hypothetical protein O0L34_g19390 [Tuta absoluta]|nr:hypothetical protein O0L34_g19390 [Tuta absoluta]